MRYILLMWFAPLTFFWGWYGLSAYDINMGMVFFSRDLHDAVFAIYGNTLGVAPDKIPPMVAGASIIDSALLGAIAAFRWRASWYPQAKAWLIRKYSHYFAQDVSSQQTIHDDVYANETATGRAESEQQNRATNLQVGPVLPAE